MESNKKTARMAGVLYLLLALGSFFAFFTRADLVVTGNAAATAHNILANETLFRASTFSEILGQAAFALLALALYELFKPVNRRIALVTGILILVPVPIALVNMQNLIGVLPLLHAGGATLQAQAMTLLDLHAGGIMIAQVFWGLWLIPFGWLVIKSGFLPKVLGYLLIAGSAGYLVESAGKLLTPGSEFFANLTSPLLAISGIGEMATVLWLLVFGVRKPRPKGASGAKQR